MTEPAISVKGLSKSYRLGVIGRQTLADEFSYWWHKARGRDPRLYMGRVRMHSTASADQFDAFGNFLALRDVSFDVQPGEVVGIIGRNGAGKSTLLKILSRITEPTGGEAVINGRVGSLLEVGTGFHPELTGRENIYMNGTILGMKKTEIDRKFDEIVAFSEIEEFLDTPVKRYSSGMYVRLAFAVAAHLDPEILLVDEVLAVGDVEFQKKCLGKMKGITAEGRTVLFVSHNMAAIKALCRRCYLVDKGRIAAEGPSDHVVAKYLDQNLLEGAVATEKDIESRQEGVLDKVQRRFRIHEVSLRDASGVPRKLFNSDEDIRVSVTFESLTPVQNVVLMLEIVDENTTPILGSQNADDASVSESFLRMKPGVYTATCLLPRNTFGGRMFYVTVHLVYPKAEHLTLNKILEFEVKFGGYNGNFGGSSFLRPPLNWTLASPP